jgi:heavy metal translocating P-type ATPase
MADRYAAWFVPLTLALAGGAWWWSGDPVRAVAVLVVATPCPLILAAPVAMVAGMAQSARHGVVVKGGSALERLAQAQVVLFDKTGTLTAGHPSLAQVTTEPGWDPDRMLRLAAGLDQASPHVVATAIVVAARARGLDLPVPTDVTEHHGRGVEGTVEGLPVAVGKLDWLAPPAQPDWLRRARRRSELDGSLLVLVAVDGRAVGALVLEDPLRSDAPRMVRALRTAGVDRVVLVTGDRAEVAESVGHALGIDEVFAERLPEEKLGIVRTESLRGTTAFVGDGINDAPALAAADVGVALGVRGATASSEAADVVLMVDRVDRLADAIAAARRATRIARQSVLGGMGLSLVAMGAAAAGLLPPAWGALLQEVIDVLAIANALRAARPVSRPQVRGAEAELGHRLYDQHRALRPELIRVREVADGLDDADSARGVAAARELYVWLENDLMPHETAEEEELYPVMARALGGTDPIGAMSRAHVEIGHLVRRVGRLLAELSQEHAAPEDVVELRRVLYGLHAVLLLHFAQEEEGLFPLLDPRPTDR